MSILPPDASRLEVEAQNELHLFLAYVYRLGYHKLLILSIPAARRPGAAQPVLRPATGGVK